MFLVSLSIASNKGENGAKSTPVSGKYEADALIADYARAKMDPPHILPSMKTCDCTPNKFNTCPFKVAIVTFILIFVANIVGTEWKGPSDLEWRTHIV